MFESICNWIVLIAAVIVGITNIAKFFGKPIGLFKNKCNKEEKARTIAIIKEVLPELLKEHDLETRERYKADRERYLKEICADVTEIMKGILDQQNATIEKLTTSSKDILREKIMSLYQNGKATKTLEHYQKEALVQWYKDYKSMKGNSYIDKYYKRMNKWAVLPDPDQDEDEE